MSRAGVARIEEWLRTIPLVDPSAIQIQGRLVETSDADVSIEVERARLHFSKADVIRIKLGGGQHARQSLLMLRVGATLVAAEQLDTGVAPRRPFALAVRPRVPVSDPAPHFLAAERRFLSQHGIVLS